MSTSKDFIDVLIEKDKHIQFSGAGAAHQNCVAERGIQTVIQMDRTMLIHSYMCSPQGTITDDIWPMDIDHAVWLYNRIPCKDYVMLTYKLWGRSSFLSRKNIIPTCHTWGAPAYLLQPKVQKGGYHIPKWTPHSHCGIFLEFIRLHSTMVGLIIILHTRSIYPQFHVVFNDMFTTVASAHNEEVLPQIWTKMITNYNARLHISLEKDTNPRLVDEWLTPGEVQEIEVARFQWIEQQHSLRHNNTSCQDWPESTTRE